MYTLLEVSARDENRSGYVLICKNDAKRKGLGFRIYGVGYRVQFLKFAVRVWGLGFSV